MRKYIFIIISLIIIFFVYSNNKVDAQVIIPDGAIRVRVIANSNTIKDQSMKMLVKEYIEENLSVLLLNVNDIDDARDIINNNIDSLNYNINKIFSNHDYNMEYKINFGNNYFPDKEYRGVIYSSGEYESLVVTIGSGEGDNWWCVLFPPLCLLEATEDNYDDITYTTYIKEIIDKN